VHQNPIKIANASCLASLGLSREEGGHVQLHVEGTVFGEFEAMSAQEVE